MVHLAKYSEKKKKEKKVRMGAGEKKSMQISTPTTKQIRRLRGRIVKGGGRGHHLGPTDGQ